MSKEKIEELKAENEKLREQIIYLQQDIERLELQNSGLRSTIATGGYSAPWGPWNQMYYVQLQHGYPLSSGKVRTAISYAKNIGTFKQK